MIEVHLTLDGGTTAPPAREPDMEETMNKTMNAIQQILPAREWQRYQEHHAIFIPRGERLWRVTSSPGFHVYVDYYTKPFPHPNCPWVRHPLCVVNLYLDTLRMTGEQYLLNMIRWIMFDPEYVYETAVKYPTQPYKLADFPWATDLPCLATPS